MLLYFNLIKKSNLKYSNETIQSHKLSVLCKVKKQSFSPVRIEKTVTMEDCMFCLEKTEPGIGVCKWGLEARVQPFLSLCVLRGILYIPCVS